MDLSEKILKKAEFFSSAKVSIVLLFGWFVFFVIGIWADSAILKKIFITIAIFLFALLILANIVWFHRFAAQVFAHWRNDEKKYKDAINLLAPPAAPVNLSPDVIVPLEKTPSCSQNFFSPAYVIPHSDTVPPLSSSLHNSSGENQVDIHVLHSVLADFSHSVLTGDDSFHVRKVITIISPDIQDTLAHHANLVPLAPMENAAIDSDISLILIDENQFHMGQWSGVLTTQRTHSFQSLFLLLKQAKEARIPIVIYPSHFSSHYSDVLYSMADVLLQPSEKADSGIFIIDFFSEIMNGRH